MLCILQVLTKNLQSSFNSYSSFPSDNRTLKGVAHEKASQDYTVYVSDREIPPNCISQQHDCCLDKERITWFTECIENRASPWIS